MPTISYDIWIMENGQRVRRTVTEEIPDPTADQLNLADLRTKAASAIATNVAAINAANPTNAQLVAHVKNLSRQNNALIRIVLGLLDSTEGT